VEERLADRRVPGAVDGGVAQRGAAVSSRRPCRSLAGAGGLPWRPEQGGGLAQATARARRRVRRSRRRELHLGLGDNEFHVELGRREVGPTGGQRRFLSLEHLPFAPARRRASGGELSRSHSRWLQSPAAHLVSTRSTPGRRRRPTVWRTLMRLAQRAQVLTITHLPQIAGDADST
jgi:hypothetical protein